MKRLVSILFLIVVIFALTACAGDGSLPPDNGDGNGQSAGDADNGAPGPGGKGDVPSYKDTMVPFDELVPGKRIVILQNTINYSRAGFYNADNKPVAEKINYNGDTVDAYPMTYALDFLTKDNAGDLAINNNDGSVKDISAEDFAGLYIIIDFTSDAPPVLYNPDSGRELKDFLYAVTPEGEAVYSIVSGSTHNAAEIIDNVGWAPGETYRYMAADKFYIPVGPMERKTGEIRGTLSGAVNGSFPELTIASGKINDVIYIESME